MQKGKLDSGPKFDDAYQVQKPRLTVDQLEAELRRRYDLKKATSRSYSLRALASEIKVPSTTLHKVFRGERRLGARVAKDIADALGFELQASKRARVSRSVLKGFKPLDPESQTQVSWINLAILEIIKLENFQPSSEWVARKLGLPSEVVETLVTQMESAGMIERTANGWTDLLDEASVHATELLSSEILRRELKNVMAVSLDAIERIPYEQRQHSFSIFPVAEQDLPRLKKKLVELRLEFSTATQNSKHAKDAVYGLQMGFFPITKSESASS